MCVASKQPLTQKTTLSEMSISSKQGTEERASSLSRYTAVSILLVVIAIWCKYTFVSEEYATPMIHEPLHSYKVPLSLTVVYLISIPLLKYIIKASQVDLKPMLKESMIVYNVLQVGLNAWMVYRFVSAVAWKGHPFIGDVSTMDKGTTYAVWVHYCNKYLEYLDTYFMVLRGKNEQVSFLHVYHHTTIACAWWVAMSLMPGGDSYFGALLNSWIHVMMYSYYVLSILKVSCPWKRYLTMAQLVQFLSVVFYTLWELYYWPALDRNGGKGHYICAGVQLFEMLSLFFLFQHFYKKSYKVASTKNKVKDVANATCTADDEVDQCQVAVATLTTTASDTVSKAANAALIAANKNGPQIVKKHFGPL